MLLLHSGHTSKPQLFHCFSIVSRVLYAIMVPHRGLNFSIVFPSHQFPSFYSYFCLVSFSSHIRAAIVPLFFHCFTLLLHHSPSIFHCFSIANGLTSKPQFFPLLFHSFTRQNFPLHSSLPSVFFQSFSSSFSQSSNSLRYQFILPFHQFFQCFAMVLLDFLHHYPYVTSVCLTRTQMHFPQSLPLHRINGFVRFFHGFISALLLHSGHTSKPQFFHCFSIVARVLYAIMVPHVSLNFSIVFPSHQFPSFYSYFTWHHFGPTSEPQFFHCFSIVLLHFFIIVPRFFHCFSIANGLTSKPQFFFPLLFHTVFPPVLLNRPIVYAINLSFHFINFFQCFAMVLVISVCLTLTQNAPPTIPTVAPYKRYCSFLPWFYFRASTP